MKRALLFGILMATTAISLVSVANGIGEEENAVAVAEMPVIEEVVWEDANEVEKVDAAIEWHDLEDVTITAYCPNSCCCDEWADGITYTGTKAQAGVTIAVDPNIIPLGAWVEIGGEQYHAEDIGGAIKGNRIDIFFDNHQDALDWGVQVLNVRWYE